MTSSSEPHGLVRFAGKTALVTGGGGPMGAAIARRLAAEGASLMLTDISERRLTASAKTIGEEFPGSVKSVRRANVLEDAEIRAWLSSDDAKGPVDVLVNVVGGIRSSELYQPFITMTPQRFQDTLDLNLKGIFNLVRAVVPGMIERGSGTVVNFASVVYGGEGGQADYAAGKAAVASLTRSLAQEFAPAVRVNCIAPGPIATSVMERLSEEALKDLMSRSLLRRLGRPEDIAAAVAFLSSDDAAHVTGVILPVSGGQLVSL